MSAAAAKKSATSAALTRADMVVRAARGRELADGGIAFSGMLWVWDMPIASFRNEGRGGCCTWDVKNADAFAKFEAFAVAEFPALKFEQADHLAGQLWDAAILAPKVAS